MKGIAIFPLFSEDILNEISYKEINVYNDDQDLKSKDFPNY